MRKRSDAGRRVRAVGSSFKQSRHGILVLAFLVGLTPVCRADIKLTGNTNVHFASVSEGAQILTRRDDFIQRLSAFDRSARMKTDRAVSDKEFLDFIKGNVVAWTEEEKRRIEAAVTAVRPALDELRLSFPELIQFVKTTGAEEGGAFYTRDTAVVFPQEKLIAADGLLQKTISHELFHILSRDNPKLREELYQMIGFKKCPEIELPAELQRRKITNPDAPKNDHYILLQRAGSQIGAVPILFSNVERYDLARGGEFFDYLQFQFLMVAKNGTPAETKNGAKPELVAPDQAAGFFEQVGRNTDYIIHPEEILADNFALLVMGQHDVASPEILRKMREILTRK